MFGFEESRNLQLGWGRAEAVEVDGMASAPELFSFR